MGKKREKAKMGLRWLSRGAYGGLILSGVRFVTPDIAGKYQGALDKGIAGGLMKVTKRGPGNSFLEVAVSETIANVLDDYLFPTLSRITGKGLGVTGGSVNLVNMAAAGRGGGG